ncbi:phage tail protein [Sedimentimonas flavescens]|uniref:phage tail protein n=1 Tax=Sedimentimonas flavescens TaxID=2851012 RepID=UPI001C4A659A|nr:phage tail protein [Sedimentimonas flavescens]MBW0159601.1 host specificity protein J [Sedimentimonas flavescens]
MPFIISAVTAVAGAISGVLAAGGLGAALIRLGGTLLLSYASQALMPKPKATLQARTVTLREPVVPRDLVYGRARKGGVIVFLHASGNKDQYLHLVIVLAAHRVRSIGAIWFEGEMAVSAGGTPQGRWSGRIVVEKRLGAEDQTAFASLMAELPSKWTADHRLAGCAALYLRLSYDADAFPGGIPNITVDLEGKDDILDPRTGTRGYSENPALCLADYMAHPDYGLGAAIGSADGIETASLIEAANICDETVPLAGGGTERRYACNGVVSLSEPPKTLIEGLLSSMAGRTAVQGGAWRIHAGAYRIPEVTLTADDIREGGMVLATRVSQSSNFNAVRGQFVSPENDWQPDDFPAVTSAAYLAEDGGERRWRDLSLPFTISAAMAQRLAKIELERARRQMSVRLSGKLAAWRAGVGETVMLSYDRWGFAAKPFEVQGASLDLTASGDGALLLPELVLRETSPLVYDWEASEEAIYAAAPRTTLPGPADVPAPGTPQLTEEMYETRSGTGVRTLIRAGWAEAPSEFVREYQIRARRLQELNGSATGEDWITLGKTDQPFWEIRDVKPGLWEVAVKSLSVIGVSSPYVSATIESLGLTVPPAPLAQLTLQTAGGIAILKWAPSADLDVRIGGRIVIRHSSAATATWATSTSMDEVAGSDAVALVPLKPGTYLLRARDNSGNLGPVVSVSTRGAQALPFAPVMSLLADPDWIGTGVNVALDGAALKLADIASEGSFTFPAGMDFGALRRVRLRSEIDVAALNLGGTIDARSAPIDSWLDVDDTDGAEIDVIVEMRSTDDDPAGTPAWSTWSRLDSSEDEIRAVELRARLLSESPDYNVLLSKLRIHAEEVA